MKKRYIKPEMVSRNQLMVNETIARCEVTWNYRYQSRGTDYTPGSIDDPNYGYPTAQAAIDSRFYKDGQGNIIGYYGGHFEPVGPVHMVKIDGTHYFFWEDFNNNRRYDSGYGWYAENFLPSSSYDYHGVEVDNPQWLNEESMTEAADNLQGVAGGWTPAQLGPNIVGSHGVIIQS